MSDYALAICGVVDPYPENFEDAMAKIERRTTIVRHSVLRENAEQQLSTKKKSEPKPRRQRKP